MGTNLKVEIKYPVILFDGVCNLCNGAVNFIIKRDPSGIFKFTSLQSEIATEWVSRDKHQLETLILIKDQKIYRESEAALRIAKELTGGWKMLYVFMIIPGFIRDSIYRLIAKNRYKWFGKRNQCMVPTPELKSRFLDS